eukprot:11854078-Karenia_brevis.AAC.1
MALQGRPRQVHGWQLIREKRFPLQPPFGPRAFIADADAPDAGDTLEQWYTDAEKQLCDVFDIEPSDRQAYCGRAGGPTFAWKP